jgi:hypothetical protein
MFGDTSSSRQWIMERYSARSEGKLAATQQRRHPGYETVCNILERAQRNTVDTERRFY